MKKKNVRMFEVFMQGEKSPRYPLASSIDSAIIQCYTANIGSGGNGFVSYVKDDAGNVFNQVEVKFEVTYKKLDDDNPF